MIPPYFDAMLIAMFIGPLVGAGISWIFAPSAEEIVAMHQALAREEWAAALAASHARALAVHELRAGISDAMRRARPHHAQNPGGPVPPIHLFHGTRRDLLLGIAENGIEPRTRGRAFLTRDVLTARQYGLARSNGEDYAIARISANRAYQAGIVFQDHGAGVMTCTGVPPEYIDFEWTLAELESRLRG